MLVRRRVLLGGLALALGATFLPDARAQDGPLGRLQRSDGQGAAYALTNDDAVWAARMLVGEAGGEDDADNAAVLWCMINSYMLRDVRGSYPTFKDFIRAYCTPLQPFLKSQGAIDRHRRRGTAMVEVQPGKWQLRRHVDLQVKPWTQLPATARAVVERVLRGRAPSPCGNATQFCSTATHFHDANGRRPDDAEHATFTEEYARKKKYTWFRVAGANARNNVFFVEDRFSRLPAGVVTVQPARRAGGTPVSRSPLLGPSAPGFEALRIPTRGLSGRLR